MGPLLIGFTQRGPGPRPAGPILHAIGYTALPHEVAQGNVTEYETITVEPLGPVIGAEVGGVDLSEPLGNQTFQEVHGALMRHQVISFRDQTMTLEQHKAFGRQFGELHIHPAAPAPWGHPEILVIHADEKSERVAGHGWHCDVSCDAQPPMGSVLHLHTKPASRATPCSRACTRLTTPCRTR